MCLSYWLVFLTGFSILETTKEEDPTVTALES